MGRIFLFVLFSAIGWGLSGVLLDIVTASIERLPRGVSYGVSISYMMKGILVITMTTLFLSHYVKDVFALLLALFSIAILVSVVSPYPSVLVKAVVVVGLSVVNFIALGAYTFLRNRIAKRPKDAA
ncbi:MAG: hypothetical protein COB40_06870 [Marinosulfonomonas sp.]|nr:MAG: hypothetical protein COB40_06870 [Marinosulfonomonas sp.]